MCSREKAANYTSSCSLLSDYNILPDFCGFKNAGRISPKEQSSVELKVTCAPQGGKGTSDELSVTKQKATLTNLIGKSDCCDRAHEPSDAWLGW